MTINFIHSVTDLIHKNLINHTGFMQVMTPVSMVLFEVTHIHTIFGHFSDKHSKVLQVYAAMCFMWSDGNDGIEGH